MGPCTCAAPLNIDSDGEVNVVLWSWYMSFLVAKLCCAAAYLCLGSALPACAVLLLCRLSKLPSSTAKATRSALACCPARASHRAGQHTSALNITHPCTTGLQQPGVSFIRPAQTKYTTASCQDAMKQSLVCLLSTISPPCEGSTHWWSCTLNITHLPLWR